MQQPLKKQRSHYIRMTISAVGGFVGDRKNLHMMPLLTHVHLILSYILIETQ